MGFIFFINFHVLTVLFLLTGKVIGIAKWKNVYEVAPGPEKSNLTFLGTFSASGEIVSPMVIYPYQRLPKDIKDRVPSDFVIGLSESGWMKSEIFLNSWQMLSSPG